MSESEIAAEKAREIAAKYARQMEALDRPEQRGHWHGCDCSVCGKVREEIILAAITESREPSAPQPDKCPKCLGSGELSTDGFGGNHFEKCYMCGGAGAVQEVSKEKPMEATYYVRHPDDSYTEANPQPSIYHGAEVEVRELRSALERTLGNFKRILGRKTVRDAGETIAEGERVLARERH